MQKSTVLVVSKSVTLFGVPVNKELLTGNVPVNNVNYRDPLLTGTLKNGYVQKFILTPGHQGPP